MGSSKLQKAATHDRIVETAARRFRERGIDGIGIAEIMEEAGVTVGGFYRHFGSRGELVAEALVRAFRDFDVFADESLDLAGAIDAYLSPAHRDAPAVGCALGALVVDVGRSAPEVRAIYTRRMSAAVDGMGRRLEGAGKRSDRGRALLAVSALVGAINIARTVDDPALSDEVLGAVRDELQAALR